MSDSWKAAAVLPLPFASKFLEFKGAKEDARNARAFQRETERVARASADASFAWGTRSLARQESQEIQAIALEDLNAQREFMRSFGTARAVAAEMGIEGASINQALGDYVAAEGQRAMVMDINERNRRVQRTQDFATLGTNRLNQISQFAVKQTIKDPDPWVFAINTANDMVMALAGLGTLGPGGGAGPRPGAVAPQAVPAATAQFTTPTFSNAAQVGMNTLFNYQQTWRI